MPQQQQMQMPGVFGGLMRYDEEYKSRFMLSPTVVVALIIIVIAAILILKIFFPLELPSTTQSSVPINQGGFILPLIGF
jgi:preprotein translocase subunit Sec61beta